MRRVLWLLSLFLFVTSLPVFAAGPVDCLFRLMKIFENTRIETKAIPSLSDFQLSKANILVDPETHDLLSPTGKSFKISILTTQQAEEISKEMAAQEHIPFCYPEDGCYARAHEMTLLMEKKGIITGKVFLEGDLKVETQNSPKGYVEWWYHVAPLVAVKKMDKIVLSVIDPSLASGPLTVEEWVTKQTSHSEGKTEALYKTPRFSYKPSDKMKELDKYRLKDLDHTHQTLQSYLILEKERHRRTHKKTLLNPL